MQFFSRGGHVSLLATIRIMQANDCASARTTALACLTIEKVCLVAGNSLCIVGTSCLQTETDKDSIKSILSERGWSFRLSLGLTKMAACVNCNSNCHSSIELAATAAPRATTILYVLLQSCPYWVAGETRRASQPRTLGTRRKVTKTAWSLFTIRP